MMEPYTVQTLLQPAIPSSSGETHPKSPAGLARAVRCAEAAGPHIYLGTSDGVVHWLTSPEASSSKNAGTYEPMRSRIVSTHGKAVERLIPLPSVGLLVVLSESTIHFLYIDSLESVPPQVLPSVRGVATVVLDDAESTENGGVDGEGLVSLCIVKRKQIVLAKLGFDTWRAVKEVPLPGGANLARRFGDTLCIATSTEYGIVNLSNGVVTSLGLPISQTSDSPSASVRPSIVAIPERERGGQCEFLITSHSADLTLGVFIKPDGEPTPKLIEWPSHPRALALEGRTIIALLRDDSLEAHDVDSMSRIQRQVLDASLELRTLSQGYGALHMGGAEAVKPLRPAYYDLGNGELDDALPPPADAGPRMAALRSFAAPPCQTLVIARNALQGLTRRPRLAEALVHLRNEKWGRAFEVANECWGAPRGQDEESELLRYIYQVCGVRFLTQLRLSQAKDALLRGRLHPALLTRLHPLTSVLHEAGATGDVTEMPRGLRSHLDGLQSFEVILRGNMTFNYSPPLDVDQDAALLRLRDETLGQMTRLLKDLLQGHRILSARAGAEEAQAQETIDTALAMILSQLGETAQLRSLLSQPNKCTGPHLEAALRSSGMYAALWRLQQEQGKAEEALDVLTSLIDGSLVDDGFKGGVQDVVDILRSRDDPSLVERYALWVVKRDPQAGIGLLTGSTASEGQDKDPHRTLQQLMSVDQSAAEAFLEHSVLVSADKNSAMHLELLELLRGRIMQALSNEEQRSAAFTFAEDFASGGYSESFAWHLALRSDVLSLDRLKLIMLLQGSDLYQPANVLDSLTSQPLLAFEAAIVMGKLGKHREALKLLALEVRDANSAEAYCAQGGGRVVSANLARSIAEEKSLGMYAALVERSGGATPRKGGKNEEQRRRLIKELLGIYMSAKVDDHLRIATAHLLNTQAMHLSATEVLHLMPSDWPVSTLESLLSRSLRRQLHQRRESDVKRALSLARNLEVREEGYAMARSLGGVIQEEEEDGTPSQPPREAMKMGSMAREKEMLDADAARAFEKGAALETEGSVEGERKLD